MGIGIALGIAAAATVASTAYSASQGSDVYGSKPNVPELPKLDKVQADALAANMLNLDSIAALQAKTNQLNVAQQRLMLEKMNPGYANLSEQARSVIQSKLSGQLTPEEISANARHAASRSIAGGWGSDSGVGRNLEARDLGLRVHDQINEGLDSAGKWLAFAAATTPGQFRAESMFVTTPQALDYAGTQFSRDWLSEQVRAAPDPVAAGQARAISSGISQLGSLASAGAGAYFGSGNFGFGSNLASGGDPGFNMQQYNAIHGTIG